MTRSILLVSDLNDGIDFQSEFSRIRPLVPNDVQMRHINRGELGTAAAKSQLIESFNRGLGILGYFGHGSIDQWRGDLLTSADAGALSNGRDSSSGICHHVSEWLFSRSGTGQTFVLTYVLFGDPTSRIK